MTDQQNEALDQVRQILEGVLSRLGSGPVNIGTLIATRNKDFIEDLMSALEECYGHVQAKRDNNESGMSIQVQLAIDPPVALVLGVMTPDAVEPFREKLRELAEGLGGEMREESIDLRPDLDE